MSNGHESTDDTSGNKTNPDTDDNDVVTPKATRNVRVVCRLRVYAISHFARCARCPNSSPRSRFVSEHLVDWSSFLFFFQALSSLSSVQLPRVGDPKSSRPSPFARFLTSTLLSSPFHLAVRSPGFSVHFSKLFRDFRRKVSSRVRRAHELSRDNS